jgi:hypothetical protein
MDERRLRAFLAPMDFGGWGGLVRCGLGGKLRGHRTLCLVLCGGRLEYRGGGLEMVEWEDMFGLRRARR